MKETDLQPLTTDPVYYVMAAIFAILTTGLPASLGQARFLPIVQTVVLTVFLAVPLAAGRWRRAALVMAVWIALALVTMSAITMLLPDHMEGSVAGGFELRSDLIAWVYDAGELPGALQEAPRTRALEAVGVVVGSLASAGLVGNWFLMRSVNLIGYGIGVVSGAIGSPFGLILSLPLWSLLRVAGLAGFVILFSQPFLTGTWSPRRYWKRQRTLIVGSVLFYAAGITLGYAGPSVWQSVISAFVQ